jgi:hypothetical protein
VDGLLAGGWRTRRTIAEHDGDSGKPHQQLWDLEGLSRSYQRFQAEVLAQPYGTGGGAFAVRSRLLTVGSSSGDPGLPGSATEPLAGRQGRCLLDSESRPRLPGAVWRRLVPKGKLTSHLTRHRRYCTVRESAIRGRA